MQFLSDFLANVLQKFGAQLVTEEGFHLPRVLNPALLADEHLLKGLSLGDSVPRLLTGPDGDALGELDRQDHLRLGGFPVSFQKTDTAKIIHHL